MGNAGRRTTPRQTALDVLAGCAVAAAILGTCVCAPTEQTVGDAQRLGRTGFPLCGYSGRSARQSAAVARGRRLFAKRFLKAGYGAIRGRRTCSVCR